MKQQNRPIFLVTIVATAVVVLLGVNMSQYLRDPDRIKELPAPNAETIEKWKDRPAAADDAQLDTMPDGLSERPFNSNLMIPPGEVPVRPSIALLRVQDRPVEQFRIDLPSAHWYEMNSNHRKTAEDRAKLYEPSEK